MHKEVVIGGAAGFWGDSRIATSQLLDTQKIDYLVFDYLAETTLAIMARAKRRDPNKGYATDFVDSVITNHLQQALQQSVKLVTNAGGLNPTACKEAILEIAHRQGLEVKVAIVFGDDLMDQIEGLRAQGLTDMFSGQQAPNEFWSANAYLGAQGIQQALAAGADVVITGRCVDSALTLGILVHEFDWPWDDWDKLAAGTLAGHIIECGAQATGGLFTDWEDVPDWAHMGYPMLYCQGNGRIVVSKPAERGGLIHHGAVAEQILYEIDDPGAYIMPDVVCDFRAVEAKQIDSNHVVVTGAQGRAPTTTYKANATWQDGYQLQLLMVMRGLNAVGKGKKTADALIQRTRELMFSDGKDDYDAVCIEYLGTGSHYPEHLRQMDLREVVVRIVVRHQEKEALQILQRECSSAGTSMAAGTRTSFFGRMQIQPVVRTFSFLIAKNQVNALLDYSGKQIPVAVIAGDNAMAMNKAPITVPADVCQFGSSSESKKKSVPLLALAWARSGDKGNLANIGVVARKKEYYPYILAQLSTEVIARWFGHLIDGAVHRYELPGLYAINFVLHEALDGGGTASMRSDPLGKSFAQILLEITIEVPKELLV